MLNYDTSAELRYYMANLTVGEGHAKALFGNTFLWGGISQVFDASGNPIAFTLTSESDIDWTQPAAVPADLHADLGPLGLWKHDGTSWSKLAPENPEAIAASGSILYADLGTLGLWKHDGTSWSNLPRRTPKI